MPCCRATCATTPTAGSPRDWVVDALMVADRVGIGCLVFADTEAEHSERMAFVDVILGVVALVALWWRRRHPAAVGVFTARSRSSRRSRPARR